MFAYLQFQLTVNHPTHAQRRESDLDLKSMFASHSRNSLSEEMFGKFISLCKKFKKMSLGSDDDEQVDESIEQRILAINFEEKLYRELEELQVGF